MAAKWQKTRIDIPENLSAKDREKFADEALQYIRERTARGEGVGGRKFPGYTKEYIESLDFKNAGKSGSKVNLKLSGDMIAAHDLLSHRKGSVLLGYENGTEENARAEGNRLGTYGQKKPDPKKARDFMGLTPEEVEIVLKRAGLDE